MAIEVNYYQEDEKEMLEKGETFSPGQQKKRVNKRKIVVTVLVVFIAAAVIAGLVLWALAKRTNQTSIQPDNSGPDVKQAEAQTQDTAEEATKQSETGEETEPETLPQVEIPRDEWYMTLVNADHSLSDDFAVELGVADSRGIEVDVRIIEDLQEMIEDGNADGLQLMIGSGYRSIETQRYLWNQRVNQYLNQGYSQEQAEAMTSEVIMYPGCSEHNSGLGVDIVSLTNQRMQSDFKDEPEAAWLEENAWKYGFILRYPEDKVEITGVNYEPWHYRYVGREQAELIYESGLCLEEYLEQ